MSSLKITLITAWLLLSGIAQALPGDTEQPIHISADEALRDEKRGVTVYTGNVTMTQGSLSISAELITIYRIEAEADKIIAEGNPAKLQQQQEADRPPIYAQGGVIEYYKDQARIHLRDNARMEQGGSIVTGDSIDYFINEQLVKATGGSDSGRERVKVVIPPRPRD